MKNITFAFMLFVAMAYGANQEVPKKVTKAFESKYQGARNVSWTSSKGRFQVTFEHDNLEKIANFSKDGAWTLTTASIPISELEQCIFDFINQEYPESDILGGAFVETPESEKYLITIEMGQNDYEEEEEETEDEDIGEFDSISIRLMFSPDCEFLGEE